MRRRGLQILLAGAFLAALGVVAFLSQRPPAVVPPPPYAVARVADVSSTPQAVSVVMRRGFDRVLQREQSRFGSCPGSLGCPGSTELRPTTIFLVRDEGGALHAFIGEDPRNSCALAFDEQVVIGWERLPLAVFYDPCHGSQYDHRGRVIAGPSPWDLNALATEVRDGDLYIDPGTILNAAVVRDPSRIEAMKEADPDAR